MAYFPIMLMGKVENPRSQTPPCMSDGIQDILDMHNVEILKKKKHNSNSVWKRATDPMQHLLEQLFFSFQSNILTLQLRTQTLLCDSNCQKLQRSSRIIVSHCLKNRRTNTLQTDTAALT